MIIKPYEGGKMSQINVVKYLTDSLPEICKVKDLVRVGLYANAQAVYHARKEGVGPKFFHVPKTGYLYYRSDVISFVKDLQKDAHFIYKSVCK